MNRKEEIKRLPFVVSAYKQIYRSESCCGICNLPWSVCGHEHIDITGYFLFRIGRSRTKKNSRNGRIMGKPSNLQPTVATHFYNYKQVGFIHTARRNPTDR